MKTLKITTAILLAIKGFGTSQFTIYDITRTIRNDTSSGAYEVYSYGDDIDHDMVKEEFMELWVNGVLGGILLSYNPSGYREYQWVGANQPQPPQTTMTPTTVVQTAMATTSIPKDVQVKIYAYLKNNGPATMKQIQSRLKGYSYTCQEIRDFLQVLNLIEPQTTVLSVSQQATVKI